MSLIAASPDEAAYATPVATGEVAATLSARAPARVRRLLLIRLMPAYRNSASDRLCIQFGAILGLIWGLERLLT